MKFKRNAPAVLIGAASAIIGVLTLLSSCLFEDMIESTEANLFESMRSIWAFNMKGAEGRALARADMLATLPSVRSLFAAKDRAGLLAETQEMFSIQKEKYGVDQAQFHVPPAVSFLRLHSPDVFGDDLSQFRPMVVAISQDHQIKKGVAIARSGPAVFGLVPVLDKSGEYVGSFEIGIDFGSILDGLKAAYGFELALFVEEEPLKAFAKGVSNEVYTDENRLGKFVKFHATNWALLRQLVTSADLTADDAGIQYSREAQGTPYGVLLLPVRDGGGKQLGVIAIARDFQGTRAAAGRSYVSQVAAALFGVILLAGALLVVLRGFLLRPLGVLSERFGALAAGDASAEAPQDEAWCEELQSLSNHHQSLRAQLKKPAEGGDA